MDRLTRETSTLRAMPAIVRVTLALLALALAVVLALPFVKAAKDHPTLTLLQAENELLRQENRALSQQLEAERLQSAALARLLQKQAAAPVAPAESATPSPAPAAAPAPVASPAP